MKTSFLLMSILFTTMSNPPDKAVPVEDEPSHKTVFQNDYVQVFRVTLPPGQSTLMHVHAHDDAAVRLSQSQTTQQTLGQPVSKAEDSRPGMVSARTNEPQSLTHQVNNVGTTVFDVIDVQVLKRPPGAEAAALGPVAAENPKMRVYRYELAAGGGASAQHTHARPYVVVAATPMNLRMTSPDGRSMEHPIQAGDLHWVDSPVTHTLINTGTENAVIVEVELK
jgi:quercetin dioxygenase-like cupin family protein